MSSTLTASDNPAETGTGRPAPGSHGGEGIAMPAAKDGAASRGAVLLEFRKLTKSFGATVALRDIDLTLEAGNSTPR
jgi:hypothetical protein